MKCHGALFQISVTPALTEQYFKPLSFQKRTFSNTSVVSALGIEANARDAKLIRLKLSLCSNTKLVFGGCCRPENWPTLTMY